MVSLSTVRALATVLTTLLAAQSRHDSARLVVSAVCVTRVCAWGLQRLDNPLRFAGWRGWCSVVR